MCDLVTVIPSIVTVAFTRTLFALIAFGSLYFARTTPPLATRVTVVVIGFSATLPTVACHVTFAFVPSGSGAPARVTRTLA